MKSNLITFPTDAAKSNTSCSLKSFPIFPIHTVDDSGLLTVFEVFVEAFDVYDILTEKLSDQSQKEATKSRFATVFHQ